MTIDDLTVNFSHLDKLTLLSDWQWLIDSSKSRLTRWISSPSKLPILVTAGGNAFVQDVKTATIHLLDTVDGTMTQVCSSPQEFRGQLAVYEFVERYLSVEMVVALRQAGLHLQPTQIYSFKVPPVLGGELEVSNVEIADIAVHFSVSGQIHQQVANVPTGTLIKNVRINRSKGNNQRSSSGSAGNDYRGSSALCRSCAMLFNRKSSLERVVLFERLRVSRLCSIGLGILAFSLALLAIDNSVASPKTWVSDFHALAAAGYFSTYAVWFLGAGSVFFLIALVLSYVIRNIRT